MSDSIINQSTQTNSSYIRDSTHLQKSSESLIDDTLEKEAALSKQNRETSIKYEIFEQGRRLSDFEGENDRRINANKVSAMISSERKTSSAPAFAAVVKDAFKKAGTQISTNAIHAKSTTEFAGKKGWALLQSKLGEATKLASGPRMEHALVEARIGFANTTLSITKMAESVGEKSNQAAVDASNKGAELVLRGKTGLDLVLTHARIIVRNISVRFSEWIQKTWNHAIHTAHLNYSTHLENKEKKRRTVSDAEESQHILNAMKVSSLIKELSPELYRPTEEPSGRYFLQLLEEKERNRRISEDKLDKNLRARAKHLAELAVAYHDSRKVAVKELTPVYTIESVIDAPSRPHAEAMQIFEEVRPLAELADKANSPPPKIFADYVHNESPKSFSAAM